MNRSIKILTIIIAVIAADQISKNFVSSFGFEVTFNEGISLNLLNSVSSTLLTFLMIIFAALVFFLFKKNWLLSPVASGFFFGGALSNIWDRVSYGAVRDWLKIPFFDIYNNLADWFIFIGLILFLIYNGNKKKL